MWIKSSQIKKFFIPSNENMGATHKEARKKSCTDTEGHTLVVCLSTHTQWQWVWCSIVRVFVDSHPVTVSLVQHCSCACRLTPSDSESGAALLVCLSTHTHWQGVWCSLSTIKLASVWSLVKFWSEKSRWAVTPTWSDPCYILKCAVGELFW